MDENTPDIFSLEEPAINVDKTANEDGEITLTPAQVVELLEETWMNEKFSPEILPHKSEVVDCILGQISYMEENLKSLDNANFRKGIHQLEVDRLKFLITSYLRTRVMKIEMYIFHILNEEAERMSKGEELYLSEKELDYARKYRQNLQQNLENVVGFNSGTSLDQWRNDPIRPNMHTFVFAKSKTEIEGVVIDDADGEGSEVVDLNRGSQMLISYHSVANLVKKGAVRLI